MRVDGLIFDFDGVLVESEKLSSHRIAAHLSALGHPTTAQQSMALFMGLSGAAFVGAVERHIGGPIPAEFHHLREVDEAQAMADGIAEVEGAVAFVRTLPADLAIVVASSSSTRWIAAHLRHLGLLDRFAGRIVSGREHVARGKPAPDVYLHAARLIGVPIERCAILEDSMVGVTGAVASGGFVIGFSAGTHCSPDHRERLLALGADIVAGDWAQVAAALTG